MKISLKHLIAALEKDDDIAFGVVGDFTVYLARTGSAGDKLLSDVAPVVTVEPAKPAAED